MKKLRRQILLPIIAIMVLYRIGPQMENEPTDKKLPQVLYDLKSVDSYVQEKEAQYDLKADNEARIVWADSVGTSTEYVLLYLHGFSASWYEGYPVNVGFVEQMGCNAYYARLEHHGLITEAPMQNLKPKGLYDSAKEALLIAKTIGKKVIIMSTSTGGTLSLMLAADYPDLVDGLIMYSPNIEIRQMTAKLLSGPWGFQLGKLFEGGEMRHIEGTELEAKYWYLDYRMEATVALQQLLDDRMNETTFSQVKCPVFVGYYYKDNKHQDDIVSVEAIQKMYEELGSDKKQIEAFTEGRHALAFIEGGAPEKLLETSVAFAHQYLGMK
jgi:esterase/lipase